MGFENRISPLFELLFENEKEKPQEGIIVFDTPKLTHSTETNLEILETAKQRIVALNEIVKQESGDKRFHLNTSPIIIGSSVTTEGIVTESSLDVLKRQPDIKATPNQPVLRVEPTHNNNSGLSQEEKSRRVTWGLDLLKIEDLHKKIKTRGRDFNIGVIDTGVHRHPALEKNLKRFAFLDGSHNIIEANPPFDLHDDGHGTHVAGIIAGEELSPGVSIGVAPEANLVVAGINVGHTRLLTVLWAIEWLAKKNGVSIINLSLGWERPDPTISDLLDDLIKTEKILLVAAIGNKGRGSTTIPANRSNVLSVGAIMKDDNGDLQVADYSGGDNPPYTDQIEPDIVAPGTRIYSCIPDVENRLGACLNGTSMAAPHVTACCALLKAAKPDVTVSDIVEAVKKTAWHPNEGQRPNDRWGWGLIRPIEAFETLNS